MVDAGDGDTGIPRRPERVGDWDVGALLGSGGMALVYEGTHRETGARAALKQLREDVWRRSEVRARFQAEVEAVRTLDHPNIVRLLEVVDHPETPPTMVLERVEGIDLEDWVGRFGPPPPLATLALGTQLARALAHAHARDVLHRDVKPGNVVVGLDGMVKLTDFGLARHVLQPRLTEDGRTTGTPGYMPPERVVGRKMKAQGDQWSLGIVLFELLAGHRPFTGDSTADVMLAIRDRRAPAVPGAPRDVRRIVARCLAPEPSGRYEDSTELASALGRALSRRTDDAPDAVIRWLLGTRAIIPPTHEPTRRHRRRWGWAVAALAVAGLLGWVLRG